MRPLLTALLFSAAVSGLAAPALAQETERDGRPERSERFQRPDMSERGGDRGDGGMAERTRAWERPAPVAQEVRPAAIPQSEAPRREWRGGGEGRSIERATPDNGWQPPAGQGNERAREGWRNRWEDRAPQGSTSVPPPVAASAQAPAPAARQGRVQPDQGRWQRGDGRPEWRGDERGARTERTDERAWRGNEAYRRDDASRRDQQWREQQSRRDRQWDRPAPRYAYDRRLDERNRWQDQRRWSDGWRNDRRYDWRDYRRSYASVYRLPAYRAPHGWSYGYRRFSIGIYLSNSLFANSYWIGDPYSYRLPPAYGSLRWVRYYDDALLIDTRDGYVVDVVYDVFW